MRDNFVRHYSMKKYLFSLFSFISILSYAQLTIINSGNTPAQLVTNTLVSSIGGVTVSNVSFQGVYNQSSKYQIGAFTAAGTVSTNLGFSSGIILTTGNTTDIPLNPISTNPGSTGQISTGYVSCTTGEVRKTGTCPTVINDLNILSGGYNYYNVAILEFDFVTNNTNIAFRYVFGSEEYCDNGGFINYNCSSYNDKFGFLISGPGIAGTNGYSNSAVNIARLANGSEVSINSVNNGTVGSSGGSPSAANCQAVNPAWVQNTSTAEFKGIINGINFNGNTKVLTASQSGLIPGSTYHIRLIITDVNDAAYDSAVFLEAASFTSPLVLPVSITYFNASCHSDKIKLQWHCSQEINNKKFIIERSIDALHYQPIGELLANKGFNGNYSFTDYYPVSGVVYYQLKQVDMNGRTNAFNPAVIEYPCNINTEQNVQLIPDDSGEGAYIKFDGFDSGLLQIEVIDPLGRKVLQASKEYEQGNVLEKVSVPFMDSGIYLFMITINKKQFVQKYFKQ